MRASERAYVALRDGILDGSFAPGLVLGEVEQSARLGVSRTPVREALRRLVAEGLVTSLSPRVLVVSGLDAGRIRDLYELREALESRAAALAARRRDARVFRELRERFLDVPALLDRGEAGVEASFALIAELDEAIDDAVDNQDFRQALASARLHSARIRRLSRHNPDRLRGAAAEHLLVIDAIIDGDAELAAHGTHVHLHRSLRNALATLDGAEAAIAADLVATPSVAVDHDRDTRDPDTHDPDTHEPDTHELEKPEPDTPDADADADADTAARSPTVGHPRPTSTSTA